MCMSSYRMHVFMCISAFPSSSIYVIYPKIHIKTNIWTSEIRHTWGFTLCLYVLRSGELCWIFPEGLLFYTSDVYRLQAGEISFILSLIKPTDLSLSLIGEEIKLQRINGFTHPADFNQIGNHDDSCRVLLPNHPPEVIDGFLHRTWAAKTKENIFHGEKNCWRLHLLALYSYCMWTTD